MPQVILEKGLFCVIPFLGEIPLFLSILNTAGFLFVLPLPYMAGAL